MRNLRLVGIVTMMWLATTSPALAQSYSLTLTKPAGATYYRTNPVPIQGRLTYGLLGVGGVILTIQVNNPSGGLFLQTTSTTNSTGYFSTAITMPVNAPLGTYAVTAYYSTVTANSTFVLATSPLTIDPTSWTIGEYGYVQTGPNSLSKTFYLSNSGPTPLTATVTHPSFIKFGTNASSGFTTPPIPSSGTVKLIVDYVNTSSPGDYSGNIVVTSAAGTLYVPVSMRVRDSLAPYIQVNPTSWGVAVTRNVYTVQSFNVANTGTAGVQVSVTESMPKVTILDSWASSFFLPPDTSRAFMAQADTSTKGQILGSIVVQWNSNTLNIPVNVTVTNLPPTVHVDSPANGTTLIGSTTITISGSDPDNDPITFSITLVNPSNPANRTVYPGSTKVWNTMSSPEGWYLVIGNATDGQDAASDSIKVRVLHNRPPVASTPSASDIPGTNSFTVSSSISDPDGDPVTATLYHRQQGSGSWSARSMSGTAPGTYSTTISSGDYAVGTIVEFYVFAQDSKGATYQTSTSSHAVPAITNRPPSVGIPVISPSNVTHSFTVWATVSDPDGDILSAVLQHHIFGAAWNSKPMTVGEGGASATVGTADGYAPGLLIEVQILVSDQKTTTLSATNSGVIPNRAPAISNVQSTGGSGHTLSVSASVTDPEGDTIATVKLYYREQGAGFSSKNMTLSGGRYAATIGPSDGISVSAVLEFKIVAADSYAAQAESSVYSAQLGNAAPTIGVPGIVDASNQHAFTITFPVADGDGDAIQSATLYHRTFGTTTWKVTPMSLQPGAAVVTIGTQHGYLPIHAVEFKAQAKDQYGASSNSTVHTHQMPNHPPQVVSVTVTASTTQHITFLNASASDPDGDAIVQILLEHRRQGSAGWTAKVMNLTGSRGLTTLGIEDGYSPADTIEYRLTISDQYGAFASSNVSALKLPNRSPAASTPTYLQRTGHILDISSDLRDVERDRMTAVLQHRRAGSDVWVETNMTVQDNVATYSLSTVDGYAPRQTVQFRVLVRDAYGGANVSGIAETTLPNRYPVSLSLTIEDKEGTHNFYAEVEYYDPDNDQVFPMCYFRKVNATEWNSFYVAKRVEILGELGAQYEVKFELSDGFERIFSDTVVHKAPNTHPAIWIDMPAGGSMVRGTQLISVSGTDKEKDPLTYKVLINGELVSSTPTYNWMTSAYPDAWCNITASCSDGELSNRTSIVVQVDNTPVEISSLNLSKRYLKVGDELIVSADMADFTGISTATVALRSHTYELRDDGQSGDGAAGDGRFGAIFDIPEVPEGNQTVVVSTTDNAGNSVEERSWVIVDKSDPRIISISTDRTFASKWSPYIAVTVLASDNFGVADVSFRTVSLNQTTQDTWTGSIRMPDSEGRYNYEVRVVDLAGRTQTAMFGPLVVDNTDPSVSDAKSEPDIVKKGDLVQVTVACADPLSGVDKTVFALVSNNSAETTHLTVELFDDGKHGDGAAGDGIYGASFIVNGTLHDGSYSCVINCSDKSGNLAQDRTALIRVDNTPPSLQIELPTKEKPIGKGFAMRVLTEDANGIKELRLLLNDTVVISLQATEYTWMPPLGQIAGRSNVTVTSFDILGHNTTLVMPIAVLAENSVIIGSKEEGNMQAFLKSQGGCVPVEFVAGSLLQGPSKENNYTATLKLDRAVQGWAYSQFMIGTNRTILFVAGADGAKLAQDQWWVVDTKDGPVLHVVGLAPDSYTVQFELPPKGPFDWSIFLKILIAVALIGLSYAVIRGPVSRAPGRREPRRKLPEKPFVPRPAEVGRIRVAPARPAEPVRIRIPPPEAPRPRPAAPPTRPTIPATAVPPTRPITPPTRPIVPPTVRPTVPPARPVTPPVTRPTVPPVRPVLPPTRPFVPPARPIVPPAARPTMPARPVAPPARPITPSARPVTPPTRPTIPATAIPPTRPITPPTRPIVPPTTRPTIPPARPPAPPQRPPVSAPRPYVEETAARPYVPERPERPPGETLSDKMKKIFKRRRGGL